MKWAAEHPWKAHLCLQFSPEPNILYKRNPHSLSRRPSRIQYVAMDTSSNRPRVEMHARQSVIHHFSELWTANTYKCRKSTLRQRSNNCPSKLNLGRRSMIRWLGIWAACSGATCCCSLPCCSAISWKNDRHIVGFLSLVMTTSSRGKRLTNWPWLPDISVFYALCHAWLHLEYGSNAFAKPYLNV